MDTIQMARELGKALQQEADYAKMYEAQKRGDQDEVLQEMMASFNRIRFELNTEMQKQPEDKEAIDAINLRLQDLYAQIMDSEDMKTFNIHKAEIEKKLAFIQQILGGSVNGEDPDTIEFEDGCDGDCGGCGGCN